MASLKNPFIQLWLYLFCSLIIDGILKNRLDFLGVIFYTFFYNIFLRRCIELFCPRDLQYWVIYIIMMVDFSFLTMQFISLYS